MGGEEGQETIDWRFKGFPDRGLTVEGVGSAGLDLFGGEFLLPVMVLKQEALQHNLRAMAEFCTENGFSLAPHGKTAMAPALAQLQLDAGAWAITAATVSQARIYCAAGVKRLLLANELVEPAAIAWVADELERGTEISTLADSGEVVELLSTGMAGKDVELPVFVELGYEGGRTGCRTLEQARDVAARIAAAPGLTLAGVEAFEGLLSGATREETLGQVDELVARTRELALALDASGVFTGDEVIVSIGGSAYFDRVVEGLRGLELSRPTRLLLRAGCYLSHDDGFYRDVSPFDGRAEAGGPTLRSALELWGAIVSHPEADRAIVGFGKRDAPFDLGFPRVRKVRRGGSTEIEPIDGVEVWRLDDQHGYISDPKAALAVGDLVGCGISHPCLAFDRWPLIAVVNEDYRILDAVRTYF